MYDIETPGKDSLEFHSVGFYDGETYSYFRSMADFLNCALSRQYRGWRFFAHFGGRFDVHYVFDWLRANAPDTFMEINCSGSCVISLTVKRGTDTWRFVDSYRLLPKSLATLTHDFDVKHKKLTGLDFTDRVYNEHDCRGLWEVLEIFFDQFEICSETIASHAMRIFRSRFMPHDLFQPNREVESFCRESYAGGRCEIYRYDRAELNHYDVNSLFPSAMLKAVPVDFLFESTKLYNSDSRMGFYRAEIKYPDVYLPALPLRLEKLYFPVGEFEGVWTGGELERAADHGAQIKILSGLVFHAEPIMRDYALALFEMKRKAESEGRAGLRYIAKILLNSLYGKWAQRREQRAFIVDDGRPGLYPLPGGLAYYLMESRASHIMPHISASITSMARLIQHDLLTRAQNWYTDTDSLFTADSYPVSDQIGALHYEGSGMFQAYRLKEYFFDGAYKVKGLPRCKEGSEAERREADNRLAEMYFANEQVAGERMKGFTESIRQGTPTVERVPTKRQRLEIRDKRARSGEFDSRPWQAWEIKKPFKPVRKRLQLDFQIESLPACIERLGKINPYNSGTLAEWRESLEPRYFKRLISSNSRNTPDDMLQMLKSESWQFESESDLIQAINKPPKRYFDFPQETPAKQPAKSAASEVPF